MDFALSAKDFDELVDPRSLYGHFLGPEPSGYVLQLILREERSKCLNFAFLSRRSLSYQHIYDLSSYFPYLVEMATRFNQDKYAHAKGKKNEPLSKLVSPLKKQKTTDGSRVSY